MVEKKSSMEGFVEALVKGAAKYDNVVMLSVDSVEMMGLEKFVKVFSGRHFNFGLSDRNVVGVAAGMALKGKLPVVCMPAMRLGAVWEQMRNLICVQNLNVKFVSCFAGIGEGSGGAMKQPFEDIALMRALGNMKILVPKDAGEAEVMGNLLMNDYGPTYLRLSHFQYLYERNKGDLRLDCLKVERVGHDGIVFCGSGDMVFHLLEVADVLEEKCAVSATVLNIGNLTDFDLDNFLVWAKGAKAMFVVEEHTLFGGLGDLVRDVIYERKIDVDLQVLGIDGAFGQSGTRGELMKFYGLDVDTVVEKVMKVLN